MAPFEGQITIYLLGDTVFGPVQVVNKVRAPNSLSGVNDVVEAIEQEVFESISLSNISFYTT